MKTAMAGTLESMDCLVTVTEAVPESGITIHLSGSGAVRFRSAMEQTIRATLASLSIADICVNVNDHGALDLVLAARVQTAAERLKRGPQTNRGDQ